MEEYASSLDTMWLVDSNGSHRALTVQDRCNDLQEADVGALVKQWLHCVARGMSMSRCVSFRVDCLHITVYEELEY